MELPNWRPYRSQSSVRRIGLVRLLCIAPVTILIISLLFQGLNMNFVLWFVQVHQFRIVWSVSVPNVVQLPDRRHSYFVQLKPEIPFLHNLQHFILSKENRDRKWEREREKKKVCVHVFKPAGLGKKVPKKFAFQFNGNLWQVIKSQRIILSSSHCAHF